MPDVDLIETLEEWNERLVQCGGCCTMPGSEPPELLYDSRTVHPWLLPGFSTTGNLPYSWIEERVNDPPVPAGTLDTVYTGYTETHNSSHVYPGDTNAVDTWSSSWSLIDSSEASNFWGKEADDTYTENHTGYTHTCGLQYTVTRTVTGAVSGWTWTETGQSKPDRYTPGHTGSATRTLSFSGGVHVSETFDRQLARCPAYFSGRGGFTNTGLLRNFLPARLGKGSETTSAGTAYDTVTEWTTSRYRFRIPATHKGTYFKITWDLAFELQEGDITLAEEDLTVEWEGPGNTEDDEDDSWYTEWNVIAMPTEAGEKRVVNIRYLCYRPTKFGSKPQITGESVEIDEEPPA